MLFSGDAPITSYFSLASTSKKRKGNPDAAPSGSVSKRTKGQLNSAKTAALGPKPTRKGKERDIRGICADKATHALTTEAVDPRMSMAEVSSPCTPASRTIGPKKKGKGIVLLTPPMTEVRPSATRKISPRAPNLSSHPFSASSSPTTHSLQRDATFLPTPTTMPRPQARIVCSPRDEDKDRTSYWTMSFETDHSVPSLLSTPFNHGASDSVSDITHLTVPSSQSQNLPDLKDDRILALRFTSPVLEPLEFHHDEMSSVRHVHSIMNMGQKVDPAVHCTEGNEDMVIGSSQSQPLMMLDKSPQNRLSNSLVRFSEDGRQFFTSDTIPSSQSQENELTMPMEEQAVGHQRMVNSCHYLSSHADNKSIYLPQRTLSDVLFSVPIQQSIFADIFSDDDDVENCLSGLLKLPDDRQHDSVTESETENQLEKVEDPHQNSHFAGREDHGTMSLLPFEPDSPSAFLDSQSHETQISQPSQSSTFPDSQGSSSSLPLAVKEFQEMFGDGEESYPPDFPMSLRL